MYLSAFQLYNYKSYLDSGLIELKPGFNILTGQNNAGKTALLEGLGLRFENKPHRSLKTLPTSVHSPNENSIAQFSITLRSAELEQFISTKNKTFTLTAIQHILSRLARGIPIPLAQIIPQTELQITHQKHAGAVGLRPVGLTFGLYPLHNNRWIEIRRDENGTLICAPGIYEGTPIPTHFDTEIAQHLISTIYSFRAERMNVGRSAFGHSRELLPDASNLPEVLTVLQSNPARFQRYNSLVRRVLPQVERITVRPRANQQVEILVWSYDPSLEREDLAIPLMESGTGISQVLAMLYVLVNADFPRVLIIDEPNSFLHPGAVRALIEILREHPQHQYIISTHSPDLISASNPSTIHILRKKEGATVIDKVDARETKHLRALLLEVGSRLSDVFGSDSVLWVEGKTEEICFPLIVQRRLQRPLSAVSIVGVLHTGDFDSADPNATFRLYEKLTQGQALLPPAIAFIFDRELRPQKSRDDLIRKSQGKVSFLKLRTYENYLLHAGALSAVLNGQPGFEDKQTTPGQIQAWLDQHASDKKYYLKSPTQNVREDVDAPKLLGDLFAELSGNTLEYNKVQHSLALTEWLLEHDPAPLQEIADLLASKLPPLHAKS